MPFARLGGAARRWRDDERDFTFHRAGREVLTQRGGGAGDGLFKPLGKLAAHEDLAIAQVRRQRPLQPSANLMAGFRHDRFLGARLQRHLEKRNAAV